MVFYRYACALFYDEKGFMNCLICRQAEMVDGFTSIAFDRADFRLLINKVPAQICPACGDAIVAENVADQLLSAVEKVRAEGIFDSVRDY